MVVRETAAGLKATTALPGPGATKIEHFATWERGARMATQIGHCVHAVGDGAKSGALLARR